jgi:hypothetical protein
MGSLLFGFCGPEGFDASPGEVGRALFAAAIAQVLVATMEMIAWRRYLELSILNGFFYGRDRRSFFGESRA